MNNILYLSQLLPYPPDAGPKMRSYHVLQYLAQKHRITLLAFYRPDDKPESIEHLKMICEAVHLVPMLRSKKQDAVTMVSSLLTGQSFVIRRDFVPEMAHKLDELLEQETFNAVHADQLWMAQYGLRAKNKNSHNLSLNPRLILDEHNACFQIVKRLAKGERNFIKRLILEREWRTLMRYEAQACAQFDQVVTVTEEDRSTLQTLMDRWDGSDDRFQGGNPLFSTIPICVDTQVAKPVKQTSQEKDVLHLGTMFWLPNVEGVLWFAREVWPLIEAQIPEARFTIVGKNPPREIENLKSRFKSVNITGYVMDPHPYLERASVFIVPLLSGGGMRVKIVDAWRWGLPVVSTTIGAEGIEYRSGENIIIADGAEAFAQAVVDVLSDLELAQKLRENGRAWVETYYEWRKIYTSWDMVHPPV